MKLMTDMSTDYHMHSINYSDWLNTIDEIVQYVDRVGMKEIAITDHSQAVYNRNWRTHKWWRDTVFNRKNVLNNVNVILGVEWDLLNENWDCCFDIQWHESDFLILSVHRSTYNWNLSTLSKWLINAIKRYWSKIKFLGHPCHNTLADLNIEEVTKLANIHKIGLEFNAKNFVNWKTDLAKLDKMLKLADMVYVNSDAHMLCEILESRKMAYEFLEKNYSFYI